MKATSVSGWSGQYVWEPSTIDRVDSKHGLSSLATLPDEPPEDVLLQLDRVRKIMEDLPPREYDFIDMYFFRKIRQTTIAQIFRVSQPTVCYRLQRATARIQFILKLPELSEEQIIRDLSLVLKEPMDVQIMSLLYQTTCQSSVAKKLGVTQGLVRHRFLRSNKKIHQHPELKLYADMYDEIAANLNILREIQRMPSETVITHCLD